MHSSVTHSKLLISAIKGGFTYSRMCTPNQLNVCYSSGALAFWTTIFEDWIYIYPGGEQFYELGGGMAMFEEVLKEALDVKVTPDFFTKARLKKWKIRRLNSNSNNDPVRYYAVLKSALMNMDSVSTAERAELNGILTLIQDLQDKVNEEEKKALQACLNAFIYLHLYGKEGEFLEFRASKVAELSECMGGDEDEE